MFIAVLLRDTSLHPLAVFALLLIITSAFGAAMGWLIHALAMPAFIVTLAGMFLARGVAYMMTIDSVAISHPFYSMLTSAYWLMPGKGRLTLIGVLMLISVLAGAIIAHPPPGAAVPRSAAASDRAADGRQCGAHDGAHLRLLRPDGGIPASSSIYTGPAIRWRPWARVDGNRAV